MHPADIKASLEKVGQRPARIAKKLGVTKGHVSRVIKGTITSLPVAKAISKAVGLPVTTLWPDRYTQAGKRSSRLPAKRVA